MNRKIGNSSTPNDNNNNAISILVYVQQGEADVAAAFWVRFPDSWHVL